MRYRYTNGFFSYDKKKIEYGIYLFKGRSAHLKRDDKLLLRYETGYERELHAGKENRNMIN